MTELGALPDDELIERARHLRRLALRGDRYAHLPAHEHESEVRRRRRMSMPPRPATAEDTPAKRAFWRFW